MSVAFSSAMDEHELDVDPIVQFGLWLHDAREACPQGDAMTLATAARDGRPSARVVLLRAHDERGFVFFTNRGSRKGAELNENPRAALVFHWWELGRQVRVEGSVEEISDNESAAYWQTRPRESQIAAWASPQSTAIDGRAELEGLYADAEGRYANEEIPLPPFWGGFRVLPDTIEFWLHRDNRLHDRIRYERSAGAWFRERLAP
jgi:pyridoxamine 5'-phosphate oxidase